MYAISIIHTQYDLEQYDFFYTKHWSNKNSSRILLIS